MLDRLPIIGVMGSGKEVFADFSVPVGKLIAEMGFNLLTGGGNGVMFKASEAFTGVSGRKGKCIGIIPAVKDGSGKYVYKAGYPNEFVEIPIYTPLPALDLDNPGNINRNYINILTADVVIALPGTEGTRNEIDLSLRFGKPIMLFCPDGFYDDIIASIPRTNNISEIKAFIERYTG